MLELTVPWDWIEEACECQKAKYLKLVEECTRQGWTAYSKPTEVGCRGFAGKSLNWTLSVGAGKKSHQGLSRSCRKSTEVAIEQEGSGATSWGLWRAG